MFGKLKNKLKGALNKFSKEVEEEAEVVEEVAEAQKEEFVEKKEDPQEETTEKKVEETNKTPIEEKPEPEEKKEEPKETIEEVTELQEEAEIIEEVQEKEDPQEETTEEKVEETNKTPIEEKTSEKKTFLGGLFSRKDDQAQEEASEEKALATEKKEKKESFFGKLTKVSLSEEKFEKLFWDLEITLLENNVAVEVIERIKEDLKTALTGEKASRKGVEELILETLKKTITDILSIKSIDLLEEMKKKEGEPLVIALIGVNGSGKTTTLAKLIHLFQQHNKSIVVAAADTFRAAAIDQLEEHTTKLGVKLIKHDYNADPAAVAYDAVQHAKAKKLDVVLIDSAGRLHSNDNLMEELKKLIRINNPDIKLFVGEAITGNDCVEQARLFNEAVGIDGIILAKADVDEKGGAAISASFVTGKPVLYLGVGQNYEDLLPFNPETILKNLDL